jgi:hypothetical protein
MNNTGAACVCGFMTSRSVTRLRRLGVVLCGGLAVNTANAAPERTGFTGDLAMGGSVTTGTIAPVCGGSGGSGCPDGSTPLRWQPGLAPLTLSLGGFVTPHLALLFRMTGTSYFRGDAQYANLFYGASVEWWPHDHWFVSGGAGVAGTALNPWLGSSAGPSQAGLGLNARAGAALASGDRHALTLSSEAILGFYGNAPMGLALLLGWKWY